MESRFRMSHVALFITGVLLALITITLTSLALGLLVGDIFLGTLLTICLPLAGTFLKSSSFLSASSAALTARLALPGERKHGRSVHFTPLYSYRSAWVGGRFSPPTPAQRRAFVFASGARRAEGSLPEGPRQLAGLVSVANRARAGGQPQ